MKCLISILLSVVLILGMGNVCLAETVTTDDGTTLIPVVGMVNEAAEADAVVCVDISWDAMTFYYNEGSSAQWSPETHSYVGGTEGSWTADTETITVTNHSNCDVTADLAFQSAVNGLVGMFIESSGTANDNRLELPDAVGTAVNAAPTASAEFGVSGTGISDDNTSLGTITVTVSSVSGTTSAEGNDNTENEPATGIATYEQLQEAFNNGGEVVLTQSIDMGSGILAVAAGKQVTLDLNGYSITNTSADTALSILGTLTLTDSKGGGSIGSTANAYGIYCNGKLTVNSGKAVGGNYGLFVGDSGSADINGGSFIGSSGAVITFTDTAITITAGTFSTKPSEGFIASGCTATQNSDGGWTVA